MKTCSLCKRTFADNDMQGKGKRYCPDCFLQRTLLFKNRESYLDLLQSLPLEIKIQKTKMLINEAVSRYGLDKVYISYSGGKDSTVLSHIARQEYPEILHVFANTTCEYPETLQHIYWEREVNKMNLVIVRPYDKYGKPWNFSRVCREEGFPMFSKVIANAIRTYRRAKSDTTKQNSIEYISRRFPWANDYRDLNISDKCCEKLKKTPLKQASKKLGLECALIGILAEESRQRKTDWIVFGCNVFDRKKENQSRPLSFWTENDIYEYINKFNVYISRLYSLGYKRNGCMFCGFGILQDIVNGNNRFERLAVSHPKMYQYLIANHQDIINRCNIQI